MDFPEVLLLRVLMLMNVDDLGVTKHSQGLVLGFIVCEVQEGSSQWGDGEG